MDHGDEQEQTVSSELHNLNLKSASQPGNVRSILALYQVVDLYTGGVQEAG